MNDAERMERAMKAQQLLANPLWIESFSSVKAAIFERWEATPIRDRDGAHELRLMLKALADVRLVLEQAVNEGKVIQFNQEQRKREGNWFKDRFNSVRGVLSK